MCRSVDNYRSILWEEQSSRFLFNVQLLVAENKNPFYTVLCSLVRARDQAIPLTESARHAHVPNLEMTFDRIKEFSAS